MPDLIQTMGIHYFNEKFHNAHFMNDDRIYRVISALREDRVECEDVENGETKVVAANKFAGFKTFEYPILGYRKFSDFVYGYAFKRQHTNRGFRLEQINITWTPCTRALYELGVVKTRITDKDKALTLLKPQFDTLTDLPKLLNGEIGALVLNSNVIVEPSTETADDWYTVAYRQAAVGKMDSKGRVTYNDPAFANIVGI